MEKPYKERLRMYIVLNDSMGKKYHAPQTAHAVAELMADLGHDEVVQDWVRNDRVVVILKASEEWLENTEKSYPDCRGFREGYWDDLLTGLAFKPMSPEKGSEMFEGLPLA